MTLKIRSILTFVVFAFLAGCAAKSADSSSAASPPPTPTPPPKARLFISGNFESVRDPGPFRNPAWKDKTGVIWSSFVLGPATQEELVGPDGCERIGGHMPTSEQMNQLAIFLGRDSEYGYHPEFIDPSWGSGLEVPWPLFGKSFWPAPGGDFGMEGDTGNRLLMPVRISATDPEPKAYGLCIF